MFKASLESAANFIKIVDALATIIDVATINISKKGLSVKAMDPSHVAMVDLDMPAGAFTDYSCDKALPIRINLTDLNRFMKRGSTADALVLTLDQQRNKLKIQFKKEKSTRTFSLGLLTEDEEEEVPSPKLDFNSKFSITTENLSRAIKDAQIVGEYITFTISDDLLILEASGDSGDVKIETGDLNELETKGSQSAMYSLEYLVDIIKAGSVSGTVNVEFSSEMPIQFNFPLDNDGKITYLLAPRVEEEEDYEDIEAEGTDESEFEGEDEAVDYEED